MIRKRSIREILGHIERTNIGQPNDRLVQTGQEIGKEQRRLYELWCDPKHHSEIRRIYGLGIPRLMPDPPSQSKTSTGSRSLLQAWAARSIIPHLRQR
jgi:hypothetical protein